MKKIAGFLLNGIALIGLFFVTVILLACRLLLPVVNFVRRLF